MYCIDINIFIVYNFMNDKFRILFYKLNVRLFMFIFKMIFEEKIY